MYADLITESMEKAIAETNRRREIQQAYNRDHGITPKTVTKEISAGLRAIIPEKEEKSELDIKKIPKEELGGLVKELTAQMQLAAANLEFEQAALLRDQISAIQAIK